MKSIWTIILWSALAIGGCATAPRVSWVASPEVDVSAYRTFAFFTPLGTDREGGTGTILSETLKNETRQQLEARGFRFVTEDPDLLVNFFVETRQVIEGVRRPGVDIRYGVFHRHYGVWADYETDIRQFTEGSLHIDVVDAARNQLVWEGVAQQRLPEDDFTFRPEQVRTAVRLVFAELPAAS